MKRRAAEEARGRKENQAGGVTKRREVDAGGVYPASSHDRLVPHTWVLSHSPSLSIYKPHFGFKTRPAGQKKNSFLLFSELSCRVPADVNDSCFEVQLKSALSSCC